MTPFTGHRNSIIEAGFYKTRATGKKENDRRKSKKESYNSI